MDIKTDLFEGGFEVVGDFLGAHVGVGKVVGLFEPFVSATEDAEDGFIAIDATNSCL